MSVLPSQGADVRRPFSLTRDNQLRDQVEAALDAILGFGVSYGGEVSKTAALAVEIAAGSKFCRGGVEVELDDALAYSSVPSSGDVHLWARVKRTAAALNAPEAPDTYSIEVTHTATNVSPGSGYHRVAFFEVVAGDIDADTIDNLLPDKFVQTHADHFNSFLELDVSGGDDIALTADQARPLVLRLTGLRTADGTITVPNWPGRPRTYIDDASGGYTLSVAVPGGTPVDIPQGESITLTGSDTDVFNGAPSGITLPVPITDGGTGATSASAARTALGLAIGTDVQAYDAELAALAGVTSAANKLPYFTGSGTAALTDLTAAARALLDDADAAAMRTTLGVGTGLTGSPTAFTQTYSTADTTVPNMTLTGMSPGPFTDPEAELCRSYIAALRNDVEQNRKLINGLIDELQNRGVST